MNIVAIDPGKNGGIAVKIADKVGVRPCPDTWTEIADLVRELHIAGISTAVIEKVHTFAHEGRKSIWTFATNYQTWRTALYCYGIRTIEVTPQKWQKICGALPRDRRERKNKIKELAMQRYPDVDGITLKTADAVMMLEWFLEKENEKY